MRNVTPRVYLIGRSQVSQLEVKHWLDDLGVKGFNQSVTASHGERLVQLCGKRCYMSFVAGQNPNVKKVRSDMSEFITNILKVGHGSVLEHVTYNFALENVSRVFTAEMNRHRAGMAISEGSMRYIRLEDVPYWIPTSIADTEEDRKFLAKFPEVDSLAKKKKYTRQIFEEVFRVAEWAYKELLKTWADELGDDSTFKDKKAITSMMRRIIPIGVASGGVWSGNLRALRHIFTMRCVPEAEEEILLVASMMLDRMRAVEPLFFGDFEPDAEGFWRPKYKKV